MKKTILLHDIQPDDLPQVGGKAASLAQLAQRPEDFYGKPQDVEWSFRDTSLYVLQFRPITTAATPDPQDDRRQWDLSLRRSFENLKGLRKKIEEDADSFKIDSAYLNDHE